MARVCESSSFAEQARFVTAMMSDGSLMKVAVDDGSSPARVHKVEGVAQLAQLKTLRDSVRAVLGTSYDDAALNILIYVINNEPVSVYRVAKTVPYSISLTYKKANRLLREGLIRQVPSGDSKDRRCRRLIESTVKGLLTGWNLGYMDDQAMLESLKKKWGIEVDDLPKFDFVFKLLPRIASEKDTAVFQNLSVLAAAVAAYDGCPQVEKGRRPEGEAQPGRCASRYVVAQALKRLCKSKTVIFASGDYTISYEPEWGRTFIYRCSLCDRGCSMTEVSSRFPKCRGLTGLLASFSIRGSPGA